eukprot:1912610-Rhodomonas_salina.1
MSSGIARNICAITCCFTVITCIIITVAPTRTNLRRFEPEPLARGLQMPPVALKSELFELRVTRAPTCPLTVRVSGRCIRYVSTGHCLGGALGARGNPLCQYRTWRRRGYGATLQTQMQESAFLVQSALKTRFLVFDFGRCGHPTQWLRHVTTLATRGPRSSSSCRCQCPGPTLSPVTVTRRSLSTAHSSCR